MDFKTQSEKGRQGEELIRRRLQAKGWTVADVRDHEYFRDVDVDFVISNDGGRSFMIDVKTDTYTSGNFYIETGKETSQRPGRIYRTQADFWIYFFPRTDTLYTFYPPTMAQHVDSGSFRTARAATSNGGYHSWSIGKLVPIRSAPVENIVTNVSDF